MATQQKPGTTVATRQEIAAAVKAAPAGPLPPELRAKIEERRALNLMAQQIANLSWGKTLDQKAAYAIAEWGRRHDVDPVTEIDILGGRVYRNAYFYRRRVAGLVAMGVIEDILKPDHIGADPRLMKLAEAGDAWAKEESTRRLRLRIEHNAPENAAAIVVQQFRVKGLTELVSGCSWCGNGSRGKSDPIGDAEPTKTAETRAYRRASLKLADVIPSFRFQEETDDEAGVALEEVIGEATARITNADTSGGATAEQIERLLDLVAEPHVDPEIRAKVEAWLAEGKTSTKVADSWIATLESQRSMMIGGAVSEGR